MSRKPRIKPLPNPEQIELFFSLLGKETATVLSKKRIQFNIQGDEQHEGNTIVGCSIEGMLSAQGRASSQRRRSEWNWLIELSWWPQAQSVASAADLATLEFLSVGHQATECARKFAERLASQYPSQADQARPEALGRMLSRASLTTPAMASDLGMHILGSAWPWSSKAASLVTLFQSASPHYLSAKLLASLNAAIEQSPASDPGWQTAGITKTLVALACASCTQSVDLSENQQQREQRGLREHLLCRAEDGVRFEVSAAALPSASFNQTNQEEKEAFIDRFATLLQATELTCASPVASTAKAPRPRF